MTAQDANLLELLIYTYNILPTGSYRINTILKMH